MFTLNLTSDNVQIIDNYKLIKNTSKRTNKNGNTIKYTSYNCSFPYVFIDFLDHPNTVYFYEYLGKTYVTNIQPPDEYKFKKVTLHCRKNSHQNTSKENNNKQWAKLVTVPKSVMGCVGDYNKLNYVLHCNQNDYVNGHQGLLEVYLS